MYCTIFYILQLSSSAFISVTLFLNFLYVNFIYLVGSSYRSHHLVSSTGLQYIWVASLILVSLICIFRFIIICLNHLTEILAFLYLQRMYFLDPSKVIVNVKVKFMPTISYAFNWYLFLHTS